MYKIKSDVITPIVKLTNDKSYNGTIDLINFHSQNYLMAFNDLACKWKKETQHLSSLNEIEQNSNYINILRMGKSVVPLILKELESDPDYWFNALRILTHEDPVKDEDRGNLKKMTSAWIEWGRMNVFNQ